MVVAIGSVTTAWNLATTAVGLFKAAAGITAGTAAAGALASTALVGGAAVGAYYSTEAEQTLQQKMDAAKAKGEPNWNEIQWWPQARTNSSSQNVTINVNNGNVSAQQIAEAIRRANRSSGTNVLQTPQ
jgi:hypothetical protein